MVASLSENQILGLVLPKARPRDFVRSQLMLEDLEADARRSNFLKVFQVEVDLGDEWAKCPQLCATRFRISQPDPGSAIWFDCQGPLLPLLQILMRSGRVKERN
jgi:hypothetical protein